MRRVHLDTDLGGDTDDLCALVMLVGHPEVELVGVTTVADGNGRRAGYAAFALDLASHSHVPALAGAALSSTGRSMGGPEDHATYWGEAVIRPRPGGGAAGTALADAVRTGATILAIGPLTNLAALQRYQPGRLADATVVMMGGWLGLPAPGLPQWGPEMDWNVQRDPDAARTVIETAAELTTVPLAPTLRAWLRARDLPTLQRSEPLGRLLARQGIAHAAQHDMARLAREHAALPDDLLNFHYDPVACAAALGWPEVTCQPTWVLVNADPPMRLTRGSRRPPGDRGPPRG